MELRQLRYFKAITDARSFARGAQQLRVAQPALSRSIAKLEEEFGISVFVRHSAGVSLTDAGESLYKYATIVLGSVRQLVDAMAEEDDIPKGTVRIGAPHSMQAKLILPAAAEFLTDVESCNLDLVQNSSSRLRDRLIEGSLDVAILANTAETGLHTVPLVRESIGVICRRDEKDRFGSEVQLSELLDVPLILSGYPDGLRRYIDSIFPHQGEALNVRCEVNASSMLTELVLRGIGYGIGPSSVATQCGDQLVSIPVAGLQSSWVIATNWERQGQRAVKKLTEYIINYTKKLVTDGEWPTAILDI